MSTTETFLRDKIKKKSIRIWVMERNRKKSPKSLLQWRIKSIITSKRLDGTSDQATSTKPKRTDSPESCLKEMATITSHKRRPKSSRTANHVGMIQTISTFLPFIPISIIDWATDEMHTTRKYNSFNSTDNDGKIQLLLVQCRISSRKPAMT